MATSGTYNFNLDIDEVIQEATEMIGGEETLGHTPASARRSINLMLNDWQNRGISLWSVNTTTVTVTVRVFTGIHILTVFKTGISILSGIITLPDSQHDTITFSPGILRSVISTRP